MLVSPKRSVSHLTELSDQETADLFTLAKQVQHMLENIYETNSSTVCVQDGPHAGQTVKVGVSTTDFYSNFFSNRKKDINFAILIFLFAKNPPILIHIKLIKF